MKIARSLLIAVGVMVMAAVLVVIAAFIPAVQRWAVLKAVASRPGQKFAVERLAIRPGSVTIHNLHLAREGWQLALADASADVSLWEAVAHRRIVIRDVRITGLQVDLTGPSSSVKSGGAATLPEQPAQGLTPVSARPFAGQTAPPRPGFDGIFKHLQLPCEIVIETCRVAAEVVFPRAADQPPGHMQVRLTGGRFAPGREAKFDFDAVIQDPDASAAVDKIEAQGVLTATLTPQSRFENLGAQLEATASGPLLPARARLQAHLMLAHTPAGEAYALTLNSPETGGENRLLDLKIDYVTGSAKLLGSWEVRAGKQQVAPFALGVALPEFFAVGEGRFEMNPATLGVRLAGRLAGEINQLGVIDPRLRGLGRLGTTATFDLEYGGGHVRVSKLVVSLSDRKPLLLLEAIQPFAIELTSQKLAAANPEKELLQLNIEGVPVAWVRPFVSTLEVAGDEITGVLAAALRDGRVWLRTTAPLTVRGLALTRAGCALLPASDISIQAEVEHSKAETRISLSALTLETAAGDWLNAQGELSMKSGAEPATAVQASFVAILPTLLAAYAPVGPVNARGAVALAVSGGTVQVDRLDAHVLTPEGRRLLELSSEAAFRFNLARWNFATLSGRSGEVLRVKFGRLPLAVFRPYLGASGLGGDLMPGEFWAQFQENRLHVAAAAPLRVERLSAGRGHAWVEDLTVELAPVVDFSVEGVTARIAALSVRNAQGAGLLAGQAEATLGPDLAQPKMRGTAVFDLSVPALAAQPFMAGCAPPVQGKISGEARFSFDHDLLGEGRLTLNGLASSATREPLPVANLSFRLGLSEKGDVAVQAPLLIDRSGERSDLTVAATLHPVGQGWSLEARISGQHFVIDDARSLVRAFTSQAVATSTDQSAGSPAPPAPRLAAPWSAVTGQVTLDVKSLVCGRNFEVTGLTGRITLDPQRLAAEKIAGSLGAEGQLQFNAEARFVADAAEPYASKYDLNLRDFEIGPLFTARSTERPPTVEGCFTVRSQAEGAGRTLLDLIAHTRGDYVLQSRKGVFRGLQQAAAAPRASGLVGGAARLIDNLGEKVGSLVSNEDATEALAGQLVELPFDQLNVRLSCDQSLHVKIADFTLVSPGIRLQGDGLVGGEPGPSLFDQPLQMRMNMGVMGRMETTISKLKLPVLSGERDELGYMKMRESFVISGTLARPDAGQLYSMLRRSLMEKLLP